MITDAIFTVYNSDDVAKLLNPSERIKLTRRGYTTTEVTLVVINFVAPQPLKSMAFSRFASLQTTTDKWEVIAPILPIKIKDAAGDSCILASLAFPRHVRLIIKRDANAVGIAISNIKSEMGKFGLLLDESTATPQ